MHDVGLGERGVSVRTIVVIFTLVSDRSQLLMVVGL